jgi:hypothetical protein
MGHILTCSSVTLTPPSLSPPPGAAAISRRASPVACGVAGEEVRIRYQVCRVGHRVRCRVVYHIHHKAIARRHICRPSRPQVVRSLVSNEPMGRWTLFQHSSGIHRGAAATSGCWPSQVLYETLGILQKCLNSLQLPLPPPPLHNASHTPTSHLCDTEDRNRQGVGNRLICAVKPHVDATCRHVQAKRTRQLRHAHSCPQSAVHAGTIPGHGAWALTPQAA